MTDCAETKDRLVMFAENELSPEQAKTVASHVAECDGCRSELAAINSIRGVLSDHGLFAPGQDYAWQGFPGKMAARAAALVSGETSTTPGVFERFARMVRTGSRQSLGWTLTAAATLALTITMVTTGSRIVPTEPPQQHLSERVPPGNEAFLGRIQVAYAREATSRYLFECHDLLLTVVRAEKSCAGQGYDVSQEVGRARELLAQKQFLDHELNAPEVARAKGLCDELERFLVNLSTAEKCERPERMKHMERYIEREQLLLRINMLQSELS